MSEQKKLMFQPFSSKLSPGFWHQLTNVKLNKLKLNIGPVDIHGTYACSKYIRMFFLKLFLSYHDVY